MRNIDFSSWQSIITTVIGLALVTLLGIGIRLAIQLSVQQRRERLNRQINERLRALIAAYKVLGGSFTGTLTVNPLHLRDLRRAEGLDDDDDGPGSTASERARRIRDAVEAALSDIILLGTEEQVRLAADAARALSQGQPIPTQALVVSLRDFIRKALDLETIPDDVMIPAQGPTRPSAAGKGGRGERDGGEARQGAGGRGGGAGGMGGGMGMGMGAGIGAGGGFGASRDDDQPAPQDR